MPILVNAANELSIKSLRIDCEHAAPRAGRPQTMAGPASLDDINDSVSGFRRRFFEEPEHATRHERSTRDTLPASTMFGVNGQNRPGSASNGASASAYDMNVNTRFGLEHHQAGPLSARRENKNYVDLTKIGDGVDVRTTVRSTQHYQQVPSSCRPRLCCAIYPIESVRYAQTSFRSEQFTH